MYLRFLSNAHGELKRIGIGDTLHQMAAQAARRTSPDTAHMLLSIPRDPPQVAGSCGDKNLGPGSCGANVSASTWSLCLVSCVSGIAIVARCAVCGGVWWLWESTL